jgi:hypothetical protein
VRHVVPLESDAQHEKSHDLRPESSTVDVSHKSVMSLLV